MEDQESRAPTTKAVSDLLGGCDSLLSPLSAQSASGSLLLLYLSQQLVKPNGQKEMSRGIDLWGRGRGAEGLLQSNKHKLMSKAHHLRKKTSLLKEI